MTKEKLEKYQKWSDYLVKSILTLCILGVGALTTHYVQAQSIHETQKQDIITLKSDVKKTIVIPQSIKMNEYKIGECNKLIDEVKKDLKELRVDTRAHQKTQNENINKILTLLVEIKSKK